MAILEGQIKEKGTGYFLQNITDEQLNDLNEGYEKLGEEDNEKSQNFMLTLVYLWEKETGNGLPEKELGRAGNTLGIACGLEKNVRLGYLTREGESFFISKDDDGFKYQITEEGKGYAETFLNKN